MIHRAVVIYNLHWLQIVALGNLPVIKTVGRGNLNLPLFQTLDQPFHRLLRGPQTGR